MLEHSVGVGVEVSIHLLVGKSKLSQNRQPRDRLGAAQTLAERGHDELAQRMRDPQAWACGRQPGRMQTAA
jgi:predicted FMN-binding regulatory protein PaiB